MEMYIKREISKIFLVGCSIFFGINGILEVFLKLKEFWWWILVQGIVRFRFKLGFYIKSKIGKYIWKIELFGFIRGKEVVEASEVRQRILLSL